MPDRVPKPTDPSLMLELAKRKMQQEMPDELGAANVRPMGTLDHFLIGARPGVAAVTYPNNTVGFNLDLISKLGLNQGTVDDIMSHELTHVRQHQQDSHPYIHTLMQTINGMIGKGTPYGQNPWEMEANQTAKDRMLRDHRSPSDSPGFPPFSDGPYRPYDVQLPAEKAQ